MINSNELVSIYTTVKNGIPFFERSIPSIQNQTYSNFEWIIIDDNSTDETFDRLVDISKIDSRIKPYRNPHPGGRVNGLNFALNLCKSEFVFNFDFDDECHPERIINQYSVLKQDEKLGAVSGWFNIHDEIRNEFYLRKTPIEHDEIKQALGLYIPFAHTFTGYRKSALEKVGLYSNVTFLQDLHLWAKIIKGGYSVKGIPKTMGTHYVYKDSHYHQTKFVGNYFSRLKEMTKVCYQINFELKNPIYNYLYLTARTIYGLFPNHAKRFIRNKVFNLEEIKIERKN